MSNREVFRQVAEQYVRQSHVVPWTYDAGTEDLVAAVYHCGVWDKDYRTRFPELKKKPVSKMDEAEIYAYLTMIICTERTQDGCIDAHILNGKLLALVKRWLELEVSE